MRKSKRALLKENEQLHEKLMESILLGSALAERASWLSGEDSVDEIAWAQQGVPQLLRGQAQRQFDYQTVSSALYAGRDKGRRGALRALDRLMGLRNIDPAKDADDYNRMQRELKRERQAEEARLRAYHTREAVNSGG